MTSSLKQDYIDYRIQSAKETLKAAKLLAENSHWNSAINSSIIHAFMQFQLCSINMTLMPTPMLDLNINLHYISSKQD